MKAGKCFVLITCVMVGLRLAHVTEIGRWSWLYVLSPIWAYIALELICGLAKIVMRRFE